MAANSTVSTTVKKNLALQDPNNTANMVQVNQPQQPVTSEQAVQASNQSALQINKQAQQGFTSPTAQTTTQQAQKLLSDPNMGRDFAKEQTTQLAQYDRNRAQSLEAARQGMAGSGGSTLNQNELMRIALQGAEGRSDLENQLQSEAAQAQQSNLLAALAEGRATSQTEQDVYNTNINALKEAVGTTSIERQAAATAEQSALDRALQVTLKNMDTEAQTAITTLKGNIDKGLLTTEQDWKTAQAALDREAATALQNGDIQGQIQIQTLKSELEAAQQKSQQQWQTAERVASQAYNTSERVSTQDYDLAKQLNDQNFQKSQLMQEYYSKGDLTRLQADLEEAKANNDLSRAAKLAEIQNKYDLTIQDDVQAAAKELAQYEASEQRYLQDQKNALELKMQTQDFDQEQKMAYLDAQLADAKANNDVTRQKSIIQFQTSEDLRTMAEENGYDTAMANLNQKLQLALQNDDQAAAEALQSARLNFEGEQAGLDRSLEKARVDLEAKQVDMQQIDDQYNKIMELVQSGALDESAGYEFVMGTLKEHGVDTSAPEYQLVNSQDAAKKALQAEYDLQTEQFKQTHPEYLNSTYRISSIDAINELLKTNSDAANKLLEKTSYNPLNTTLSADDLSSLGVTPNMLQSLFTVDTQGTAISGDGLKAMNDFVNNALYGELTDEQKEAKKTAGYLTDPNDIPSAAPGDKFNFTQATTYNGQSIPAGKYTVKQTEVGHGNKFFGTKYTNTHTYLVNTETNEEYEIDMTQSGKEGNIVSNLWA